MCTFSGLHDIAFFFVQKRCRFVSEGSSSDSDDADNSLLTKDTESKNSVQKTPAAAAATNQLAQLSSSDDDGKASAASEIGTSIEAESEKLHSGNNNIKDAAVEDPAVENNSNVTAIAASQLAQLSSSDEDPNSSSAVPDVDKSTLSKSKSNFVIAISKRAIAGPRSSGDKTLFHLCIKFIGARNCPLNRFYHLLLSFVQLTCSNVLIQVRSNPKSCPVLKLRVRRAIKLTTALTLIASILAKIGLLTRKAESAWKSKRKLGNFFRYRKF